MYYQSFGNPANPALLLIHGFCEDHSVWAHYIPELQKDYRVIAIDLPGFGKSPVLAGTPSIEAYAQTVREMLARENVVKPRVIGHSLGGYVALALADRMPSELERLVLFHSTSFEDTAEKKANRNRVIDFLKDNGVSSFVRNFVTPLFAVENRASLAALIENLEEKGEQQHLEGLIYATEAMRDRYDRKGVLEALTCPILFICGKQDTAIPMERTQEEAFLPNESHLLILDHCGHMGMFEKPEVCLRSIKHFLV